ncbi:MAG: hypothetical protein WBP91_10540, partial [Terriglobales bacterium]
LALEQDRALHGDSQHQRSDVIFADAFPELNPFRVGIIQELRQHFDSEELSNFLFGRHPAQGFVGPPPTGFVEMDGPGLLKTVFAFVFSKTERCREQERDQQKMSKHAIDNNKSQAATSFHRRP